ncbi:hypothetical protein BJY04DRAFT_213718 [Aspergillus karnatakaensis]|uniref:uncharacterized protein n=1 Tax=Aspergillus karnatakaensis TaxID=1810916 RepID=UPI003CCD8335
MQSTSGRCCWMCGYLDPLTRTHIIPLADESTELMKKRALINFRLNNTEMNTIQLCLNCDGKFNDVTDPGILFYPTDIASFIRFELRDRARRKSDGSARRVPTAAMYIAKGGLYNRIMFTHWTLDPVLFNPKIWPGAPLAALKRAFMTVHSPRAGFVPEEDTAKPRDLYDLYYRDGEETIERVAARYRDGLGDEDYGLGDEDKGVDAEEAIKAEPQEEREEDEEELEYLEYLEDEKDKEEPPRKRRAVEGSFNFCKWSWEAQSETDSETAQQNAHLVCSLRRDH